jgi:RHS repeat-associated protein
MQARYQNSSRGQFVSEDPLFLGDPKRQALIDPKSFNAYGYANDNPITNSDPTGRCIEDGCVGEFAVMAARAYVVNVAINESALVASNVYGNVRQGIQNNSLSPSSFVPTVTKQQYLSAAGEAIPASVLGPVGGKIAARLGVSTLLGSSIGVGASAGLVGEFEQPYTGDSQGQIVAGAAINGLGNYGAGKYIGGTPGRDVKSVFSPNFYLGSHMQNEIRTGVVQQGLVTGGSVTYSGLVASLSRLVTSLQSLVSSLQASNNKK